MPEAVKKVRRCPNCSAVVPKNATNCVSCKMDVAQMDTFKPARGSAPRKVYNDTENPVVPIPWYRSPGIITGAVLLLVIAGFITWRLTRPAPPPAWTRYPTTQDDLVTQMFTNIAVGDDPGYDKAYALLAPSAHDRENKDELGQYRQLYHEIFKYLNNFDTNWAAGMKIEHDPTSESTMLVHVGPETLHVNTQLVTPPDIVNDTNKHYGTVQIAEFNVGDASDMGSTEARKAIIGSVAGQGALNNLNTILGASGGRAHETPMQLKLRTIPLLHDPRHVNNFEV